MRRAQFGFSLIELLVVLFIIGVIIGAATISVSGRALDDEVEQEARRLNELFRLAQDEAGMTGLELGWVHVADGYRFLALGEKGWTAYGDTGQFRPRPIKPPLAIQVEVDDLPIPSDPERLAPQILFLSSGEITPFKIEVMAQGLALKYRLEGNLLGKLSLSRINADE